VKLRWRGEDAERENEAARGGVGKTSRGKTRQRGNARRHDECGEAVGKKRNDARVQRRGVF
jgi:hypothetical protein